MWTAAIQLSKYIEAAAARGDIPHGATMVEIGSGTGLVGLVGAAVGGSVSVTDLDYVIPRLERNVAANVEVLSQRGSTCPVKVAPLHWGETDVSPFVPCDYVLACEVIYSDTTVPLLVQALKDLSTPQTTVILAYDLRGRVGVEEFFAVAVFSFILITYPLP